MKKEIVSFNEDVPGLAKLLELSDETLETVVGGVQEGSPVKLPVQNDYCQNYC